MVVSLGFFEVGLNMVVAGFSWDFRTRQCKFTFCSISRLMFRTGLTMSGNTWKERKARTKQTNRNTRNYTQKAKHIQTWSNNTPTNKKANKQTQNKTPDDVNEKTCVACCTPGSTQMTLFFVGCCRC